MIDDPPFAPRDEARAMAAQNSTDSRTRGLMSPFRTDAVEGQGGREELRIRLVAEALLHDCAQGANEAPTPDDAISSILESICRYTRCYASDVLLLDGPEFSVVHRCRRNGGLHADEWRERVAVAHPVVRAALKEGLPGWINNGDGGESESPGHRGAAAPITAAGQTVGALVIYFGPPVDADNSFLLTVQTIGRHLGEVVRRANTEAALRASEKKSVGILETAADAVVATDRNYRIQIFNRAAERAFGYRADEIVGHSLDRLIPERFRSAHPQQMEGFASSAETSRVMGRRGRIAALRKDGSEFPAGATISKLELPDETLFTVLLRDLTAQVASERARADAAATDRLLAEAGRILASTLDYSSTLRSVARLAVESLADWCIVYVSQVDGTLRRLEVAHADPEDQTLADELRAQPLPPDLPYPIHTVLVSGRTEWATDLTPDLTSGSGILQHLGATSFVAVPLKARGQVTGAMAFVSKDPSHAYGPDSIEVAEKLATTCAMAIDNARLYAEAKEATRRRDEILHMVSHDLRSPLAAIKMGIERLTKRSPVPDRRSASREILGRVDRLVNQMNRLIEDLLDLGYLERGQLALQRASIPADKLAKDVVARFQDLAAVHDVRLDWRGAGNVLLDVDGDRAEQVLANLVDNAIRYGGDGGHVSVVVTSESESARISVVDEGPGIDPLEARDIFDPYAQARRTGRGGAGLGLAIAKRITEAHSGEIWVDSELGKGSAFHVRLPRAGIHA